MKILVTGGAGFIGSHVADAFLAEGHEVVVVDNLSSGRMENIPEEALFLEEDITSPAIAELFAQERFDLVSHHAAQVSVRVSVEDPLFDAHLNISGTIRLLELCREYSVGRFMFASSGGATYGEQSAFPAGEEHPQLPACPYGISKLSGEHYVRYYDETFGIKGVSLRYSNVYGPRQSPHGEAGVVAIFASGMLRKKEVFINGDGKQTRDFVYVQDLARANVALLNAGLSGAFNVGTGEETDICRIFELVKNASGSVAEPVFKEAKKGEQRRSVIDYTLLKETCGWSPSVTIEEGIEQTVEFFRHKTEGV